jgi:hypothetical protein
MKKLSTWDKIQYNYDWKTIFGTTIFILGCLVFFLVMFNRGYIGMQLAKTDYSEETVGMVINRAEQATMKQTGFGNVSKTDGVKFYYTYFVDGAQYYNKQTLDYSIIIAQQLNKLRTAKLPVNVTVRYNKDHPSQSMLWFK